VRRVLVTGATGFVGRHLCTTLVERGYAVRAAVRSEKADFGCERAVVGEIDSRTDWDAALDGVDAVVHLAARAHVMRGDKSLDSFVRTNALGTQRLASEAARRTVSRFVYLSTVKVNGEKTGERSFTASDEPHPEDPYGVSKWLGEQYLREVAAKTRMQAVIVRAPLVYGPGARANFLRLMQLVDKGLPLPFGAVDNRRSLVNIWNLQDLLVNVLTNDAAPGRTWMVSDGDDVSTPELVQRLATALGRKVKLVAVPERVLRVCASMIGARAAIGRLCNSLTVDVATTRTDLTWSPPVSMNEALARTVQWYRAETTK
jgi:nucleoside-diphosphate-sugar epimerase